MVCCLQVEPRSGEWIHCFNLLVLLACNALRFMGAQLRLRLIAYAPQCAHIWARDRSSPTNAKTMQRANSTRTMPPILYFVASVHFTVVHWPLVHCNLRNTILYQFSIIQVLPQTTNACVKGHLEPTGADLFFLCQDSLSNKENNKTIKCPFVQDSPCLKFY